MAGNFVPPTPGSTIGKPENLWSGGYFDKIAVKEIEVLAGAVENDAPATMGWVKRALSTILKDAISQTGLSIRFGTNGFVMFGSVFDRLKIQWGRVSLAMLSKEVGDETVRNVILPISFEEDTYKVIVWDNNPTNDSFRLYKACSKDKNSFQVKVLTYKDTGVEVTPEDFSMAYFTIGR